MQNGSGKGHLRAYNKLHQYLVDRGLKPLLQKLDNEASTSLKRSVQEKGIKVQLVSHTHHCNAAGLPIQTFKITFWRVVAPLTSLFPPYNFGTRSSRKLLPPSTYFAPVTPQSLPFHQSSPQRGLQLKPYPSSSVGHAHCCS
jgi:hypothetical protein